MKPLQTDWIKTLPVERREDFEKLLRNSTTVFHRQLEILSEWENAILSEERTKTQYEIANWDKLQAHRNGNLEIIKKLKDLISFAK